VEAGASAGQQYGLLVSAKRGWAGVADLKGRSLLIHRTPSNCLAPAWLDTVLAEAAPGGFEKYFGGVAQFGKISKAVLPVYFGQADVCLVDLRAFQVMSELNPQLGREMRVVTKSERLIPSLVGFHRQCSAAKRSAFASAVLNLYRTPAGKQALTLFQSSGSLAISDQNVLNSAIEIAAASDRIRSKGRRKS
jgi:ABC-type phosphate/phosphonate transport system substrate-binding protein